MGLTLAQEKEFCYIYLLKRYFKGDTTALARVFTLTREDIATYDKKWGDAVHDAIYAEKENMRAEEPKAPSIRGLKERLLIRIAAVIDKEDDPSKLANTYARLSEFQQSTETQSNSTNIADSVMASLKMKGKGKFK
jgi:hypothetical protein